MFCFQGWILSFGISVLFGWFQGAFLCLLSFMQSYVQPKIWKNTWFFKVFDHCDLGIFDNLLGVLLSSWLLLGCYGFLMGSLGCQIQSNFHQNFVQKMLGKSVTLKTPVLYLLCGNKVKYIYKYSQPTDLILRCLCQPKDKYFWPHPNQESR